MTLLYLIIFFIFGITLGSFYNVVGFRLPIYQSIVKPSSYCPNCNKNLKWYNLIPLLSYIIQGGKCSFCKCKISIKYFLYELLTGILFSLSFFIFGFSNELIIALTFISILIIVIISDIEYMLIPDELIIAGAIFLLVEMYVLNGFSMMITSLISGVISFLIMWGIKILGDFAFKKESMGGGDIKLMFIIGLVFNYQAIILVIFLGSVIALPYAIFTLLINKDNIVPYGPFLSLASIGLLMMGLEKFKLIDFINLIS